MVKNALNYGPTPMTNVLKIAAVMAAVSVSSSGLSAAQADDCLTDWGAAGEIVRREKLLTVEELAKSLRDDGIGQVVKTTLCKEKGGYVYHLVVRDSLGKLKSTVVSAKIP
jgi:hypothetical protein